MGEPLVTMMPEASTAVDERKETRVRQQSAAFLGVHGRLLEALEGENIPESTWKLIRSYSVQRKSLRYKRMKCTQAKRVVANAEAYEQSSPDPRFFRGLQANETGSQDDGMVTPSKSPPKGVALGTPADTVPSEQRTFSFITNILRTRQVKAQHAFSSDTMCWMDLRDKARKCIAALEALKDTDDAEVQAERQMKIRLWKLLEADLESTLCV